MDDQDDFDVTALGHAHAHLADHLHGGPPPGMDHRTTRVLWWAVGVCAVATVVAIALLWPSGGSDFEDPLLLEADVSAATVVAVEVAPCSYDPSAECDVVSFELDDGRRAGEIGIIEQGFGLDQTLSVGDGIKVTSFDTEAGDAVYSFYDFDRDGTMIWLLVIFVAAVLLLGRWRGLGALAGLGVSLGIIVVFTLPAVLDGAGAVWVALATAAAIAFFALFLAHGFEVSTAVAMLSTFASLVVTALLAWFFVGATNLTGLADESSIMLGGLSSGIDPRGILLAGVVIGALGVLDDVTVTQVSAVWELKRARPDLTMRQLAEPALRIGRDHISSTVNTLFLAYAGAALPLLLLFTEAGQGFGDVATREIVATEVVRALVGSIGLVASVPISTYLAAYVVSGSAPEGTRGRPSAVTPTDDTAAPAVGQDEQESSPTDVRN